MAVCVGSIVHELGKSWRFRGCKGGESVGGREGRLDRWVSVSVECRRGRISRVGGVHM